MAIVVAAEELRLLAPLPHQQQQVPISGLNIKDFYLRLGVRPADDLEELAPAVAPHVDATATPSLRREPLPSPSFILAPMRANFPSSVSRSTMAASDSCA